ncbi:unnamed protein product [Trichogramma brassicae]|uniref:Endonuclease/exonuclease/phosphatase domain-containing protein n=1 Tax=Trichogramma brassicae TaxID=86971 RepID=A0A6H5I4U5_9HYME|nr:unnamed protein product [Trichogramma brassicae]
MYEHHRKHAWLFLRASFCASIISRACVMRGPLVPAGPQSGRLSRTVGEASTTLPRSQRTPRLALRRTRKARAAPRPIPKMLKMPNVKLCARSTMSPKRSTTCFCYMRRRDKEYDKDRERVNRTMKALKEENVALRGQVNELTMAVNGLTQSQRYPQPWTEVKFINIDSSNNSTAVELAEKILGHYALSNFSSDIITARKVPQDSSGTKARPGNPATVGKKDSIIVKLKSAAVRDRVLEVCGRRARNSVLGDFRRRRWLTDPGIRAREPGSLRAQEKSQRSGKGKGLPFCVWVREGALRNVLPFLADFMKELDIDVLSISETWCTPDIPDASYKIPGYKFARADRGLKKLNDGKNSNNGNKPSKPDEYMHGGGVGLYIRDTIKWREIRKSAIKNMNETEYIIVELHGLNGDRILMASAYRRPRGRCLTDFFEVLSTVSETYSDVIITGDLNSDLSATDVNEEGRDLEKLLEENSYYPVPFGPTHHQVRLRADPVTGQRVLRESHTWIDVICVSLPERVLSHRKSREPFIQGHDYIAIDYAFGTAMARETVIASRDFRRCDAALLRADVGRALDDAVPASGRGVTSLLQNFYSATATVLDRHAPMSVRTARGPSRPWCSGELRRQLRERDRLYRTARRCGSAELLLRYRRVRKELKIRMRAVRDAYYSQQLASAGDAASRWSVLRRLGLARPTLPSPFQFFSADELVSHYASVTNLGAPCGREELDEILLSAPALSTVGFGLSRIEAVDVLGALHACSSRARGRSGDGLSLRYLRDAFTVVVAPALAEIFNASIEERKYPDMWKETLIVPLSKKSRPETPADTRPVANLPHLSRVFDRLICPTTRDLPDLVRSMNEDAATIKDWADRNGLVLNTAKTKAVLFASSQQRRFFSDSDVPPLIVDNTIIPLEDRRVLARGRALRFWLRRDDRLAPFLERMGCASLEERRRFFLGVQVYRAVSLQRPHYLSEMFRHRDTGTAPQTRSSSLPQLMVPDSSSEVRRRRSFPLWAQECGTSCHWRFAMPSRSHFSAADCALTSQAAVDRRSQRHKIENELKNELENGSQAPGVSFRFIEFKSSTVVHTHYNVLHTCYISIRVNTTLLRCCT